MNLIDHLHSIDRSIDAYLVEEYELLMGNADRNRKQEARYRELTTEMERINPSVKPKRLTKPQAKKIRPISIKRAGARITLKIYDMAEAAGMSRNELTAMLSELVTRRLEKGEC